MGWTAYVSGPDKRLASFFLFVRFLTAGECVVERLTNREKGHTIVVVSSSIVSITNMHTELTFDFAPHSRTLISRCK